MTFGHTTEQKLLRESVRKLMDTHAPPAAKFSCLTIKVTAFET